MKGIRKRKRMMEDLMRKIITTENGAGEDEDEEEVEKWKEAYSGNDEQERN